jgi:hypothetical protein
MVALVLWCSGENAARIQNILDLTESESSQSISENSTRTRGREQRAGLLALAHATRWPRASSVLFTPSLSCWCVIFLSPTGHSNSTMSALLFSHFFSFCASTPTRQSSSRTTTTHRASGGDLTTSSHGERDGIGVSLCGRDDLQPAQFRRAGHWICRALPTSLAHTCTRLQGTPLAAAWYPAPVGEGIGVWIVQPSADAHAVRVSQSDAFARQLLS